MVLGLAAIASTQNAYAGKGTRNFVFGTIAGVAGLAAINSLSRGGYYNRGYYNDGYYNAGYRYRRGYRRGYRYDGYYNRRPSYPRYYRNYYRPRYQVRRHRHSHRPVAWSKAWYRYCASKYRSFRRSDGTFKPYNGARRVCR